MKAPPPVPFSMTTRGGTDRATAVEITKKLFLMEGDMRDLLKVNDTYQDWTNLEVLVKTFTSWLKDNEVRLLTPPFVGLLGWREIPFETKVDIINYIKGYASLKKQDSYYERILFGDVEDAIEDTRRDVKEFSNRKAVDSALQDIDDMIGNEQWLSNLEQYKHIEDLEEIVESVKYSLLDDMYEYVYDHCIERGVFYRKSQMLAHIIYNYVGDNFTNLQSMIQIKYDGLTNKLSNIGLPSLDEGGRTVINDLKAVINEYLSRYPIEEDTFDEFVSNLTSEPSPLPSNQECGNILSCAAQHAIRTLPDTYREMWNRPMVVGVQSQALVMKALTEDEIIRNKLNLLLEPRHDFTKLRAGESVRSEVEKLVDEYKSVLPGSETVSFESGFERKNYLDISSTYDNSSNLHVFSYENKLTSEKKTGDFYNGIKSLIETFIQNTPVVLDAKGTVFLKKLFNVQKEAKSVEIAIDATGKGKIEASGTFLVDYPNDIFRIPKIPPTKITEAGVLMREDALKNMKEYIKVGIKSKKEFKEDWRKGTGYNKDDSVRVTGTEKTGTNWDISELSVDKLSDMMKKIRENPKLNLQDRKKAMWSFLNLKRSGDQGQALYAKNISGVFDTLDFLAASFTSINQIPYMVNSDNLKTLFVMFDINETYEQFENSLRSWVGRLDQPLSGILINVIDSIKTITMNENEKKNILGYIKELYSLGLALKGKFSGKSELAGKVKEFIRNIIEKIIEKRSIGNDGRTGQVTTYTFIKSQVSVILYKSKLVSLCKNFFGLISRLHQAVKFFRVKLYMLTDYFATSSEFTYFKESCLEGFKGIIETVLPGLFSMRGSLADYIDIMTEFSTAITSIKNQLFSVSNISPDDLMYVEEFFGFMNTITTVFKPVDFTV